MGRSWIIPHSHDARLAGDRVSSPSGLMRSRVWLSLWVAAFRDTAEDASNATMAPK